MQWRPFATFSGHRGPVYALVPGDRPNTFLSASGDGRVVRWDITRPDHGEVLADVGQAVFTLYADHERKLLFIGNESGGLHVIDLAQRREVQLLQVHRKGIFAITSLPDDRLVCAGGEGSISVWGIRHRDPGASSGAKGPEAISNGVIDLWRQIPLCEEKVRSLATNAEGTLLAVACGDGNVRILDTELFNERHTLSGHEGGSSSVVWHPAKPILISGGKDGHLRLWRTDDGFRPLHGFAAHRGTIYTIAFGPDDKLIATASRDKSCKLWDANSFDPIGKLDRISGGHTHSVNAALWLDRTLITASDDRTIIVWSTTT